MHLCLDDKCVIFWQNRETLFQKGFVRSLKLLDLHNSDLFISNYLVIKRVKRAPQKISIMGVIMIRLSIVNLMNQNKRHVCLNESISFLT